MTQVPEEAIDLIKNFEGLALKKYICPAGKWTIGWGHLCKQNQADISLREAEKFLINDLNIAVDAAVKLCPNLPRYPKKLAAITSFVFNLGAERLRTSTLRKRINEENWELAGKELDRWVWGGGLKLPGLARRREAEKNLLLLKE